ncbi:hypothetical protein EJB05_19637, partial [Eragrostis curvula]
MLRSVLGRASRRLSASSAAPSVTCRRGPAEILKRSLSNAAPWVPRPGAAAHLMRAFTSPTAGAPAAPTRRIPNLQRHFPVFSERIEGVKLTGQKRFFSTERKEPVVERIEKWLDNTIKPWHLMSYVAVVGLSSFVATTIAYHRLGTSVEAYLKHGKSGAPDGDGH